MRASCLGHCLFFRDDKITACFNGFSGVVKIQHGSRPVSTEPNRMGGEVKTLRVLRTELPLPAGRVWEPGQRLCRPSLDPAR